MPDTTENAMALFKFNDNRLLASLNAGFSAIHSAVFKKSGKCPLELLAFYEKQSSGLEESRGADSESLSLAFSEVLQSGEDLRKSYFFETWLDFSPDFHFFRSQGLTALYFRKATQDKMSLDGKIQGLAALNFGKAPQRNLDRAVKTASAVSSLRLPALLRGLTDSFHIDTQEDVLNPLGLSGLHLETTVRFVFGGAPAFHPQNLYGNFKSTNNLALIQQAYLENKLAIPKQDAVSKWPVWRDLF